MKKLIFLTSIAFISFSGSIRANEKIITSNTPLKSVFHPYFSNDCCHSHRNNLRGPTGPAGAPGPTGPIGPTGSSGSGTSSLLSSYYSDINSLEPSQLVTIADTTAQIVFPGTNTNQGINLVSNSLNAPLAGLYTISWNLSASIVGDSSWVNYHINLQKNGTLLLSPVPQAQCSVSITAPTNGNFVHGIPNITSAASVIVPLEASDQISLILTIDGSEGQFGGDGVKINSAQISATYTPFLP